MSVYSLQSDNEFISADDHGRPGGDIVVYFYHGDIAGDFKMISSSSGRWDTVAFVGPAASNCRALQVFGTTIAGSKLKELCDELNALANGGLSVSVNRLGHCIVSGLGHELAAHPVRLHDHFGWSKYGVKLPQDAIFRSDDELRRSLEEKNVELAACRKELEAKSAEVKACKEELKERSKKAEETTEELRRSLEEKAVELKECREELERSKEERNVELAACKKKLKVCNKEAEEKSMELTTCRKELEWSKKNELLWSKLVEEKEKVNEMMHKNQILAFKAADDH